MGFEEGSLKGACVNHPFPSFFLSLAVLRIFLTVSDTFILSQFLAFTCDQRRGFFYKIPLERIFLYILLNQCTQSQIKMTTFTICYNHFSCQLQLAYWLILWEWAHGWHRNLEVKRLRLFPGISSISQFFYQNKIIIFVVLIHTF